MKIQKTLKLYGVRLAVAFLYLTMALVQVIRAFPKSSLMVITHSIMFMACAIYVLSCNLVNYFKLPDVVQLCNAFIKYDQRFTMKYRNTNDVTPKTTTTDLLLKYMIYLLTCTGICMPMCIICIYFGILVSRCTLVIE